MSRATDDLMDALHGALAQTYIDQLKAALASGEGISPALLTSAAKFLKDNGIDRPARDGNQIDELADLLPEIADVINFPGAK